MYTDSREEFGLAPTPVPFLGMYCHQQRKTPWFLLHLTYVVPAITIALHFICPCTSLRTGYEHHRGASGIPITTSPCVAASPEPYTGQRTNASGLSPLLVLAEQDSLVSSRASMNSTCRNPHQSIGATTPIVGVAT
jgi:hypothetical protein